MQTTLSISPTERARLEAIISRPATPQKHVWRCRIVLLSGNGLGTMSVVAETGKSRKCVRRWRERFIDEGVDGLLQRLAVYRPHITSPNPYPAKGLVNQINYKAH